MVRHMFFESDNIVTYSLLDLSRAMSPLLAGIVLLLLLVNEVSTNDKPEGAIDTSIQYLCISTLLSYLTHMIAGFFLFGAIIVLGLIIYQPVSLHWSFYKNFPLKTFSHTETFCLCHSLLQFFSVKA